MPTVEKRDRNSASSSPFPWASSHEALDVEVPAPRWGILVAGQRLPAPHAHVRALSKPYDSLPIALAGSSLRTLEADAPTLMMDPFPDDWQLIQLFESDPQLGDERTPWAYNRLEFTLERDNGRLRCVIEPGHETLALEWTQEGETVVELKLHWVRGLEVRSSDRQDLLVATLRDAHLTELACQTAPRLSVSWGTTPDCP